MIKKNEPGWICFQTEKVKGSQESIDYIDIIKLRNLSQAIRKTTICDELEKYVNKHLDSYLSLWWLHLEVNLQGCNLNKIEKLFDRLSDEVKNSDEGKYFKEIVERQTVNSKGNLIPDIKIPNQTGDSVILSSLIKGKTIISFWASWCGPCREKHKDMVKNQRLFEDKSVKIIGISLDDDQQKWLKAINYQNR